MTWSYRKRIKIIPGVRLNISKSGISTSIGVRGASMTFSKNATYLNTGIPGTGLYNRQKIAGKSGTPIPENEQDQQTELVDNIFSADIQEISSHDMQGIKKAIITAHNQRMELITDSHKIKSSLKASKSKLAVSYFLIYGLLNKAIPKKIKADISAKQQALAQLHEQIENCYVALDIEFDPDIKNKYDRLLESFKTLCKSAKIWDVTGSYQQDRKETRSAASTAVNRKAVSFGTTAVPEIKSAFEPLWLKNANGADLYVYPHFVMMYSNKDSFALISLNEINFTYNLVKCMETESIPADSKIIDTTWAKVNKNGSPDKRFKDNYEIPIVGYGEITLQSNTGLHEQYHISNYEYTEAFGNAFIEFQNVINTLKSL
jgi:uncharacterized protein DUF4236